MFNTTIDTANGEFQKEIIPNPDFYIVKYIKQTTLPYLLFIHGGPGFHCGVLEYLIANDGLFQIVNCNIILYDQRNCGRSPNQLLPVSHDHNVKDLNTIVSLLKNCNLELCGLAGHSYGAKVLCDYAKNYYTEIPLIFVATSEYLLRPRLNNLMLDLIYLKKNHVEEYNAIYSSLQTMDKNKLWEISERLTPFFLQNKDRGIAYWANIDWWHRIQEIEKKLNISINFEVLKSVRKDLYSNSENLMCDIGSLKNTKLWINGFHDFIMDGAMEAFSNNQDKITFYQSAHYPHIEENEGFCRVINEFLLKHKRPN